MTDQTKPEAGKIGWRLTKSERLVGNPVYTVRKDTLMLPNGQIKTYYYVDHPGSVFIVPITHDGEIVLIRSYRYPIDKWCWEIPAGFLGDRTNMSERDVAAAEMEEETGATYESLFLIGKHFLCNGFSNTQGFFFIAQGVRLDTNVSPSDAEPVTNVSSFPRTEVRRMIRDGELDDADSAFAIYLALDHLGV